METMVFAVEFLDWVNITKEAGMSRVKLPGNKLTTGGSVAKTFTMKGWDKMYSSAICPHSGKETEIGSRELKRGNHKFGVACGD